MHVSTFVRSRWFGPSLLGTGVLLVLALFVWGALDDDGDGSSADDDRRRVISPRTPTPTPLPTPEPGDRAAAATAGGSLQDVLAQFGRRPVTNRSARPHQVTLTITSDAPLRQSGFKTIAGEEAYLGTDSSITVSRTIDGSTLLAIVAAESGSASTVTTCTASVDGQVVDTYEARGAGSLVVCFA